MQLFFETDHTFSKFFMARKNLSLKIFVIQSICQYAFCDFTTAISEQEAFPCSSQYTMKANRAIRPQIIDENPPPYKVEILDESGRQVRRYRKEIYTVSVSSDKSHFKSLLLQARLSTKTGVIIGHLRSGEFLPDDDWQQQGIKIQECALVMNDSLVTLNNNDKASITVKWRPHGNDGPVQFVLSIILEDDIYWNQWAPDSGLILSAYTASDSKDQTLRMSPLFRSLLGNKTLVREIKIEKETLGSVAHTVPSSADKVKQISLPWIEHSDNINANANRIEQINLEDQDHTDAISAEKSTASRLDSDKFKSLFLPPTTSEPKASSSIDICAENPCKNNGICKNLLDLNTYECKCNSNWTGVNCEMTNFCVTNSCSANSICRNTDRDYTCQCVIGWTGALCNKPCPADFCFNGGSCYIRESDNTYQCNCKVGYIGERCETDFDDCAYRPCLNGGKCIDKPGSFECKCAHGFMGSKCHRPCQDIYRSCEFWDEQDRCESMRAATQFFDVNCAVTCGLCDFKNSTIKSGQPLPPILEPFEFLLGVWTVNTNSYQHFPFDFIRHLTGRYAETLEFSVPNVTMFDTPSLNYSSVARSLDDLNDMQIRAGFMSLSASFNPNKVSLLTVGNDGVSLVEEGELVDRTINFKSSNIVSHPLNLKSSPISLSRLIRLEGSYLQESFIRDNNGSIDSHTKYYSKKDSSIR